MSEMSSTMRAWQVDNWDGNLLLNSCAPAPTLSDTHDVIVRVKSASVNPIDTLQVRGYLHQILSTVQKIKEYDLSKGSRLPFTPGKDCAGVVEAVGSEVTRFRIGDKVMGTTTPLSTKGTHSELVVFNEDAVVILPDNLSFEEAAAVPYVACTAWSSLVTTARLNKNNAKGSRILIHGGAGGVGTYAIQLLKAWNAKKIVTTCSQNSFEFVSALGAIPVDYRSSTAKDELIAEGPFDVIFSCVDSPLSQWSTTVMESWHNCVHVSIVSPIPRIIDSYGVALGFPIALATFFVRFAQLALCGKWFAYGFFKPNLECMQETAKLIEEGKIRPVIDKVFPFEELPEAFAKVSQIHGRGKTVVNM